MSWGLDLAAADDAEGVVPDGLEDRPGILQLLDDGLEVGRLDAGEEDVAPGQGPGDEEGPGLDPVGDDLVAGAAELPDALDPDRLLADPVDLGPHLDQELAEVGDLGLEGAVAEDGLALGQGGGHDQVLGPGHRLLLELDGRARELVGLGLDVAVLEADGRPELLQAADVEVDRPRADGAAAGQGDDGLAEAGQERAEDEDGRPHGPDELVGGLVGGDLADLEGRGRSPRGRIRRRAVSSG